MLLRICLDLPDEAQSVPLCRGVLRCILRELAIDTERAYDVEMALSEAAGNVVRHAYAAPGNRFQVRIELDAGRLRLQVTDRGRGFNREDVPAPDTEQLGGRGLWIIEKLADATTVSTLLDGGVLLEAEFRLPTPAVFAPPAREPERDWPARVGCDERPGEVS